MIDDGLQEDFDGKYGFVVYNLLPGLFIGIDDNYFEVKEGCNIRLHSESEFSHNMIIRGKRTRAAINIYSMMGVDREIHPNNAVASLIKPEEVGGLDVALLYDHIPEFVRFGKEQIGDDIDLRQLRGIDAGAVMSMKRIAVYMQEGKERFMFVLDLKDRLEKYIPGHLECEKPIYR